MCSIFPGRHYFNILFPRVAIKQKFSLKPMADCFKISCDNIDIRLMPASPASDFQQHRSAILLVLVGSSVDWLVCAIIFILRHCCWFSSQSDIMPVSEWSLVYRVGRTAEYNKLPIRSFVQSVASLGRWFPFAAAAALSMGATAAAAAPANTMSLAFLSLRTNQPAIQAPTDRPTYLPSTTTPAFLPYIHPLYISILLTLCKPTERTNVRTCMNVLRSYTTHPTLYTRPTTRAAPPLPVRYYTYSTVCAPLHVPLIERNLFYQTTLTFPPDNIL